MEEKKKSRRKVIWIVCITVFAVWVAAAVFLVWNPPYLEQPLETGIRVDESTYHDVDNNLYRGLPVFVELDLPDFPAEDITFEFSAAYGGFCVLHSTISGTVVTAPNDSVVAWSSMYNLDEFMSPDLTTVYTKVIIRCEGHIIGYAVVRFDSAYGRDVIAKYPDSAGNSWEGKEDERAFGAYFMKLVKAAYFPKVLGCYQPVAQKYVERCMQEIIDAQ